MKRIFLSFSLLLLFSSSSFATVQCDVAKPCFLNLKGGENTPATFIDIAKKHTYACSFHANMNPKVTVSNVKTPVGITVIPGNNNNFTIYSSYNAAPFSNITANVSNVSGNPNVSSLISFSCGKF